MSSPIADAASPEEQSIIDADAEFEDSPSAASLCKFKLPFLKWGINLKLPSIAFPPALPIPSIALAINCSLKNPISLTADIPNGGGRKAKSDPDPDDFEDF